MLLIRDLETEAEEIINIFPDKKSMHERFRYRTGDDLIHKAAELGYVLPYSEDISPLFSPIDLYGFTLANRFVVQPMEGYDSGPDGSPTELTARRYLRYARGGSSVIWSEAVSVSADGRSNPCQLWLHGKNTTNFSRLVDDVKTASREEGFNPFLVIQLTHSGRYSKPEGSPRPMAASSNPVLDRKAPYILTDDDLKRIQDEYVSAAKLAAQAGFDAVDLKACHGYLMIELLAARNRVKSIYGGEDTASRFRFMLETFERIKNEVQGIIVTARLGVSDLYQGGFGTGPDNEPDYSDALLLTSFLQSAGMRLLNITLGSPYHNPHVTRPFDTPVPGQKVPDEHPVAGVIRMIAATSLFQKKFPGMLFAGSAYSYLRQFAPNVGAAVIRNGDASLIGFGRNSFAYPDMPADLLKYGKANPSKVCIACSGCTRLIRNLRPGGCVIRDREIYGSELKKLIADERKQA
jgi:2,4-dienoyl-CoA reductase-like NADH-dependent reductase (Old Yellow Enzyme family)